MNRKPTPFTYFALGLSLLAWASAFAGIRAALQVYVPGHLILLRFLIASSLLAGYAALSKMRMPVRKDLPAILLLGLAGFTVYQVGLAFGEVTVSAGAASLLIASAPIFTAIVSHSVLHERLNTIAWLGIDVSFVGVILIVWGEGNGIQFHVGAFLIMLSALSESLYFVFQKPYLKKYRAIELTTYTIWAATMFMLVFTPGLGIAIQTAPLFATLSVVYLGIVPTVLAYLTWNIALARMPASVATTFLYLLPVLALIVAWFWLGEIPTLLAIIGGVLTLVGIAVVNWKGYNENKSIIQIRLAEASEVSSVASVLHQASVEYESVYTPEAFSATTSTKEQMRLRWGEGPVWVAVQNDTIVGTACLLSLRAKVYTFAAWPSFLW